jgi:hypothetical protein
MSESDSVALRQALWLDFVFGTPEAKRAVIGLSEALRTAGGATVEVSAKTHKNFCRWVGIPSSDNTRRGPFARWLEDAGLGFAVPDRAKHETAIVVPRPSAEQISPEAFIYGLYVEFERPFENLTLRPIEVTKTQISQSMTVKALLLDESITSKIITQAIKNGYAKKTGLGIGIDPQDLADRLRQKGPFPSQSWVIPESSEEEPLKKDTFEKLKDFPEEDCFATEGSPFDKEEGEIASVKRRKRYDAFNSRVGDAYKHRCCISGLRFRSPSGTLWHGDAAHIVPHSAKARDGTKVYGKSVLANGIFLTKFIHWCFDNGWLAIESIKAKGTLKGYRIKVATIAVDDFFKEESELLLELDDKSIPTDLLPDNPRYWPSLQALEWHHENTFHG